MAVSYLSGGESADYTKLNSLFSELNRKLLILFDGKSFLLAPNATSRQYESGSYNGFRAIGKPVFIANGDCPWISGIFQIDLDSTGWAYDHSTYSDAAAAATITTWDDTYKIAYGSCTEDLSESLEAHTLTHSGSTYYICTTKGLDNGYEDAERISKWGCVELCFEGTGLSTYIIPDTWNKYNYFRLHNFCSYDVRVEWASHHYIVVPSMGCKTVRRTAVDGTYENGYDYFFKFQSGDPRFYFLNNYAGGAFVRELKTIGPSEAVNGNNVVNPWLCEFWHRVAVDGWARGTGSRPLWVFKAIEDHDEFCNMASTFKSVFPGIESDNSIADSTLFADLFTHKGEIRFINQSTGAQSTYTLNTLEDLATAGFTVSKATISAGAGNVRTTDQITKLVKSGYDVVAWNSNLFRDASVKWLQNGTGIFLGAWQPTFSSAYNPITPANKVDETTWTLSATYKDYTDLSNETVSKNETKVYAYSNAYPNDYPSPLVYHETTVEDVKTLTNVSGHGDPSTTRAPYSSIGITISPRGPSLYWTQTVAIEDVICGTGCLLYDLVTPAVCYYSSGNFLFYGSYTWTHAGYGTPISFFSLYPTLDANASNPPQFWQSPLNYRQYYQQTLLKTFGDGASSTFWQYGNCGIDNQLLGTNGASEDVKSMGTPTEGPAQLCYVTQFKMGIQKYGASTWSINGANLREFPSWLVPDGLLEYQTYFTASWWAANRTRLLAGNYPGDSTLQSIYTYSVAPTLQTEHYNWLAQCVNRLKTAIPLNYLAIRTAHGLLPIPNRTGPYGSSYFPKGQYGSYSQTADQDAFEDIGCTVLDKSDFPSTWNNNLGADFQYTDVTQTVNYEVQKTWYYNDGDNDYYHVKMVITDTEWTSATRNDGVFYTETNLSALFGVTVSDKTTIDSYKWVTISDVKTQVEDLGFRFDFADIREACLFLALSSPTLDPLVTNNEVYGKEWEMPDVYNDPDTEYYEVDETTAHPSSRWVFASAPDTESCDWERSTGDVIRLCNWNTDYITCYQHGPLVGYSLLGPNEYEEIIYHMTYGDADSDLCRAFSGATGYHACSLQSNWGLPTGHRIAYSAHVYDYGDNQASRLFWLFGPRLEFRSGFSAEGWDQAKAKWDNGPIVVPIDSVTTDSGIDSALPADPVTFYDASTLDASADLMFYSDHTQSML